MASKWFCLLSGAALALAIAVETPAHAQATAPSSITPPTLRPVEPERGVSVAIPEVGALVAPPGSGSLSVRIDRVVVEGGFPELAASTSAIIATLQGRTITLDQVYKAASDIEAAHARAGFVLARVAVPPQSLVDGGTLRIVVIDGFIVGVDVSAVPARVRRAVAARVAGLVGRHHLTLGRIEQPLLIANEIPGLALSSTLTRGNAPGAARLVLAATHHLVSGRIDFDNSLSPALDTYGFNTQLSLNSALGLGEQIYGFAASGYDITRLFRASVPVRVLGGGLVLPIGDGRLTINPEVTFSRTQPKTAIGAPTTRGRLRRLTLRGGYTLTKTRARVVVANAVIEQLDETNALPDFGVAISHDRFMAARLGVNYPANAADGSAIAVSGQLSQGLGGLGALRPSDLPTGTTFSRQGANHGFTKLNLTLRALVPLPHGLQLTVAARGQSTFGKPVFRSEQAALEGSDALSAYVGGVTAVDEAVVSRTELIGRLQLDTKFAVQPYLFFAGGTGRIDRPTVFEPGSITAGSAGLGLRASVLGTGISIGAEYAHGFADYRPLDAVDRVNVFASLRF